jgi:hypothetical protein
MELPRESVGREGDFHEPKLVSMTREFQTVGRARSGRRRRDKWDACGTMAACDRRSSAAWARSGSS